DDPDDVRMAHRRDQLVLEQKTLEKAPAGLAGPILDDLADDPLAALLVLGEIDRRQIGRIELRDEAVPPRAEPRADLRRKRLGRAGRRHARRGRGLRALELTRRLRRRAALDRVP